MNYLQVGLPSRRVTVKGGYFKGGKGHLDIFRQFTRVQLKWAVTETLPSAKSCKFLA